MITFDIVLIIKGFVTFIAEEILHSVHVYGDESEYVFYQEYHISRNRNIIRKYYEIDKVGIDKELLKEIYLENSRLLKDNNTLALKNSIYLMIAISILTSIISDY